jgi:hypothetical protein
VRRFVAAGIGDRSQFSLEAVPVPGQRHDAIMAP